MALAKKIINDNHSHIIAKDQIINNCIKDAEAIGMKFSVINRTQKCPFGTYKVALVIKTKEEYHWYRQNPDGTWSHKPGYGIVKNYDVNNQVIYDPQYCETGGYDEFGGYFAVSSKVGGMYESRLVVTPNSGETMKQAITRELGTTPSENIDRIILRGGAAMKGGTSNEDSAKILPNLETVDMSGFTGTLGDFSFHSCSKLTTVIVPTGNIKLPKYSFTNCTKLKTMYKANNAPIEKEVDLSGVVSIGNYAFQNTAITTVKLPTTFAISQYCFMSCKNLETIYKTGNMPTEKEIDLSGVSYIGYGAFWNYSGNIEGTAKFNTVKLPRSIGISGNCFRSCINLNTIYKNGNIKVNGEADLSGVTSFGGGAFSGMSSSNAPKMSSITLPENVTISESCFQNCSNLRTVKFNASQTEKVTIGTHAFYGVNSSCIAYMNQALVNDTSFLLPISEIVNMTKKQYN